MKRLLNIATKLAAGKPPVGQTPCDVIHTENKWRLLRYRSTSVRRNATPLLLVPSLINRHYVLDLMPGKSFVEWMLNQGHDVWIIDWGHPGPEDRFVEFSAFCDRYIHRAVNRIEKTTGHSRVHLLGYCLGGTLTTIYATLHPERIASLINLAAPIDFEDDGLLSLWSNEEAFDTAEIVQACGNMPWRLMQAGFHLLRPTLTLQKLVYAVDRAWDEPFLDGFAAIETWSNDNVSFAGHAFVEYIEQLYRQNALISDELVINGTRARLANITSPVLIVSFQDDSIVSAPSAEGLAPRVSSSIVRVERLRGGHVGAVVSSKAKDRLWPLLSEWMTGESTESVAVH